MIFNLLTQCLIPAILAGQRVGGQQLFALSRLTATAAFLGLEEVLEQVRIVQQVF